MEKFNFFKEKCYEVFNDQLAHAKSLRDVFSKLDIFIQFDELSQFY